MTVWQAAAVSALLSASAFPVAATAVSETDGNIRCSNQGRASVLTHVHKDHEVVMAPDGHHFAFVRTVKPSPEPDFPNEAVTALWLGDCRTGTLRLLAPSRDVHSKAEKRLESFGNPVFSADGAYIYVSVAPGGDYLMLHRVAVRTGKHSFIGYMELSRVFRSGPHRGDLLVTQHTDLVDASGAHYGGYPYYIARSDGHIVERLPGSENWDDKAVTAWLKTKGWNAW